MTKAIIPTLLFSLFLNFSIHAQDMIVSGAGNDEVNGLYVVAGIYDGVNYYQKDTLILGRYQSSWGIADGFSKYLVDMYYWIQNTPQDTPDGLTFNLYGDRGYGAFPTVTSAPLPVELILFTATFMESKIELQWETATEVNNYGFEIERKTDNNWNEIGFISGSGNSNSPKHYLYTDSPSEISGNYSYRLKQIDLDGQFKYSEVVEVENVLPQNISLKQNFPNPFNPSTNIEFTISENTFVRLGVFDVLGRKVTDLINEEKLSGSYRIKFDASNLVSGVYYYSLFTKNKTFTKKMLLVE